MTHLCVSGGMDDDTLNFENTNKYTEKTTREHGLKIVNQVNNNDA